MSGDTPVVWLDEGEAQKDAVHALDEWARARGVQLALPTDHPSAVRIDPSLADGVEKELERAREAIGATDADTAERALARAEDVLRRHPELPEAAWLRAEVERTWSSRWLRVEPRDTARARTSWENAEALDGGRAAGIGETRFPSRPRVKATLVVTGKSARLSLRLDGVPLAETETDARGAVFRIDVAPGEHHLLAMSGSSVVFASWLAIVGAPPAEAQIAVGDTGTCSRDRLSEVRRDGDHVSAVGVTCPRWLAAAPGEKRGSVVVARCEHETCGPLLEWRVERYAWTEAPAQAHGNKTRWPAWATWTLVGAFGAAAASIALIATGAFDSPPVVPRFVVGGARQE